MLLSSIEPLLPLLPADHGFLSKWAVQPTVAGDVIADEDLSNPRGVRHRSVCPKRHFYRDTCQLFSFPANILVPMSMSLKRVSMLATWLITNYPHDGTIFLVEHP